MHRTGHQLVVIKDSVQERRLSLSQFQTITYQGNEPQTNCYVI